MPRTPPIDIKALEKSGIFKESLFFRLLSEQCNYVEPSVVKDFYMGLVRHMTNELRKNGVVGLPEIGYIALVKQKARMGFAGPVQKILPSSYVLKFYAKDAWRKYFAQLEGKLGEDGKLDPREKVLKRILP